jgi:hypothetical protein
VNEREESERIGAAIRASAESVRAPQSLRASLARRPAVSRGRVRRRLGVAAAAAAALAMVFVLQSGGVPSVPEVAAAGLHAPTRAAPAPDPRDPRSIDARVGNVSFPSYEDPWGWKAVGARTDRVDGRRAVTVIYRSGRRGVHYTIVEGKPLPVPAGTRQVRDGGRRFAVLRTGKAAVVAWEQGGHTCVLASETLGPRALMRLANWR